MSSEALWGAVARLTERPRTRLERDGGKGEWVTVDSLFEQLIEAMESGAGNGRGHSKPGSRPPCDATAMSLLIEIAEAVRDACIGLELKRRHDTPDDLRQICSRLIQLAPTEGQDEIDWWTAKIGEWCAQIRITISNDPLPIWERKSLPGLRRRRQNRDTGRLPLPRPRDRGDVARRTRPRCHMHSLYVHRYARLGVRRHCGTRNR
jgi:hypothetical protein